ncbi:Glycine reductase complex component B subunit gamma [subsurface metagenome]
MIAKEIEREGIPVAQITTMTILGQQIGTNRIVAGRKVIHPCGDPELSKESDLALRREIVKTALSALQTEVKEPTIFQLNV